MKYYIDFEASENEKLIISVGAVNEKGEEFYSLVHCDDPITPRIEEITGISQEDIDDAPDSCEVFERLYDWCNRDGFPEFINYGTGDFDFVSNSLYAASSFKEASMLSFLYLNMYDCSEDLKEFFYVNKTISLEKLGKFFDKDMGDQTHNALDDAKLLKMVHEKMKTGDRNFDAFLEYVDPYRYPDQVRKVLRMNGNTILEEYDNLNKAVEWLRTQPNDKGHKYLLNAGDKIKHAAKTSTRYFGYNWRIL